MFKIVKKTSGWWHIYNGGSKEVNISDFQAVLDNVAQTFIIQNLNGANVPKIAVSITDIIVIDETDSGIEETFADVEALKVRLTALGYTPYLGAGNADSITGLIEEGTGVTITGSGTSSDPYVINSSGGGATPTFQQVIEAGDELVADDNLRKIVISKEGQSISFYSRADVGDAWVFTDSWDLNGIMANDNFLNGSFKMLFSPNSGLGITDTDGNYTTLDSLNLAKYIGSNGYEVLWSTVVNSNTTAILNTHYTVVANATFTDASPVEGNGYVVFVRNGTATIGGTGYGVGSLVYRVFHSGAWSNTVYIDETKVEKIIRSKNNGTYGSHTGNTAETVIQTINISAGEFAIGDWMNLMADFTKTGTAGTATIRFRAGTNGTTSDALIASLFLNTTVLDAGFNRERFQFKTGNILSGVANNYTAQTFDIVASTIAKQSTSLTPSSSWILTITVQLSNSADTVACEGYVISKIKSF
jgi:hypothetical protein